ncbi:MAG: hypothetical protein LBD59_10935 [Prevotellaceae bacterium]|nr:hypothetical protein [Prevotellaceae bacterium]
MQRQRKNGRFDKHPTVGKYLSKFEKRISIGTLRTKAKKPSGNLFIGIFDYPYSK